MSRGIGKLQVTLLRLLEDGNKRDTFELAALAFGVEPNGGGVRTINGPQRAATARALTGLKEQGLVVWLFRGARGRIYWSSPEGARRYVRRLAEVFGAASVEGHLRHYLEECT